MSQIDWQQLLQALNQEHPKKQQNDPTIKILLQEIASLEAEGALDKTHPKHGKLQLTKKNLETYKSINTGWELIGDESNRPKSKGRKR